MKKGEFNPIGISDQLDWQRIRKLLSIGLMAFILMLIGDMLIGFTWNAGYVDRGIKLFWNISSLDHVAFMRRSVWRCLYIGV